MGSGPDITIPQNSLAPTFDLPYIFTVEISKSSKMSVTHSIPVYLQKAIIPVVHIASQSGKSQDNGVVKINVDEGAVLQGACETFENSYNLSWTFEPELSNVNAFELLGKLRTILYLLPGSMFTGNRYTVALTCKDSSGATGYSELTLLTNTPPKGPDCQVCRIGETTDTCAKTGIPLFDTFEYSCDDWADADLPLEYQFGYESEVNGEQKELVFDWGRVSTAVSSFPPGKIKTIALVRDGMGSRSQKMYDYLSIFSPVPLIFLVWDISDSESIGLTGMTYKIFTDYHSIRECKLNHSCGTLLLEGEVDVGDVTLPRLGPHLVVISAPGYYDVAAEVNAVMKPIELDEPMIKELSQDEYRVVLSWGHSGDLDLWIHATWGSGDWDAIGWETPGQTAGDGGIANVTLDLDNQDGSDGPESVHLEGILSGKYEVWINSYAWGAGESKFRKDLVQFNPATIDIYCSSCRSGNGSVFHGLLASITQSAFDIPSEGASWWKAGEFRTSPAPASLQWEVCTSGCYTETGGVQSWFSRLRSTLGASFRNNPRDFHMSTNVSIHHVEQNGSVNLAIPRQVKTKNAVPTNRSQIRMQFPQIVRDLQKHGRTGMELLPQVKKLNNWNKSSISRLPARSENIGLKTKNVSSFSKIRRGRKLLSLDEVSTWADAHALLQMALDRQDYSEANSISAALSLKVDAHLTNDMISSEGAAFQKTFLVAKITESLNTAIKTEGYACDVLGVLQVISSNTNTLIPESAQGLYHIVKTLLSEDRYASLKDQCAENALSVTSNVLDHLAYKQDCNNSQNGSYANIILNELEGNMKLLANKQCPRLFTGQTSKIITMNVTSQVTKRALDDIFDEIVSMFAAAGGIRNLSVSYKLPGTMLQDITALQSLTEISVQFDTYHHAPVVNGIQPISPLVGLRLFSSSSGSEILVSGLTQNVEIIIPIVNQSVCELSDYQDFKLKCMYWTGDSYKSDGCSLKKVAAGYVTCVCSHLTTIVVVPDDGRLYRNSSVTTLTSTPKPSSVLPLESVRIPEPIILPEPEKNSNTGVIAGSVVGAICFICVASSAAYHFLSLRSRKCVVEETMVTPPPPPPALMTASMPLQPSKMPGGQRVMMSCAMNPMQMEPPPFPRDLAPTFPQIQRKEDYSEVKRMLQRTSNLSPASVSKGRPSSMTPVDVDPNEEELR
jgi:hypothetical protein